MNNLLTSMRFMVMWIIGNVVSLYASLIMALIIGLLSTLIATFFWTTGRAEPGTMSALLFSLIVYSLIGTMVGLLVGSIQKSLLRQKTDEDWQGWIIASIMGAILAVNVTGFLVGRQLIALVSTLTLPAKEVLLLMAIQVFLIPFACISMFQTTILMRYVRGSWAWILGNSVAGIVMFSLIAASFGSGAIAALTMVGTLLLLSVVPGIITGFTMIWLIHFNWKNRYPEY